VAASSALAKVGIVKIYLIDDHRTGRQVSMAVSSERAVHQFTVMMSDSIGTRHEGESVTVAITDRGRIARGERRAYTMGVPAARSDDRKSGLLPQDSVKVFALMNAGLALCPR
jgi:hypothetical protein